MTAATPSTLVSSSVSSRGSASVTTDASARPRPAARARTSARGVMRRVSGSAVAVHAIRVGCSGWNYPDWRGVLYPAGCPQRRWLERYAEVFDTVEVNATFYRLPTATRSRMGAPDAAGLRLRGQVQPLPDAHQAPDRHGAGRARASRAPGAADRVAEDGPDAVAAAGATSIATTSAWPSRSTTCRRAATPSSSATELVRRRGADALRDHDVALAIADHPERPWQRHELTADFTFVRLHHGRRGRRGTTRHRARRVGARARAPGAARRGLRLLQQRLGGIRGPQRFGDARAPGRVRPPGIHPRRDLLCF